MSTIYDELETIREGNGGLLRPPDVVEFAKNPDTLLHKKFTWDDTKAANEHRLWQARMIIRVAVNVIDGKKVRTYVSVYEDRESNDGYRTLVSVMSDEDLREKLLAQAKQEMLLFRAKYKQLVELVPVFEAMESIIGDEESVAG